MSSNNDFKKQRKTKNVKKMSKEELEKEILSLRQEVTRKGTRIANLYYTLSIVCSQLDGLELNANADSWATVQTRLNDLWSDNVPLLRRPQASNNNSNNNNQEKKEEKQEEEVGQVLDQVNENASKEESKEYFHGEGFTCSICYSPYIAPPHNSSPLVMGCGHICCVKCCKSIYEGPKKTCPFCNKKIEKLIPLYN